MRAVFVTPSSFRTVNAGALRNVNVGNALASRGAEVTILSGDATTDPVAEEWNELLSSGVTIQNRGASRGGLVAKLRRILLGTRVTPQDLVGADALVLYNPNLSQYLQARRLARATGARVVVDVSEWLAPEDLPGSWASPYSWLYESFMKVLPSLLGSTGFALAISSPMAIWLGSRGANTLVVPPLSAVTPVGVRPAAGPVRVVVSGSGIRRGGKDGSTLALLEEIASRCPSALTGIEFDILGNPDPETAKRLASHSSVLISKQHGWVEWRRTLEIVEQADYLMLVRDPSSRRQFYGYPSKVIESLALNTAVIVNECGGLTDYLVDGRNSIIIREQSAEGVAEALERAVASRGIGGDADRFSPEAWSDRLSDFVFGAAAVGRAHGEQK